MIVTQSHTTDAQSDPTIRVRKFLQVLTHTSSCQRQNCVVQCAKMRAVIRHFVLCGNCNICKKFFSAVYFHSKSCESKSCKMHFCSTTKKRIARLLESEEENQ